MTPFDLLKMQYRNLVASDARLDLPEAWLPILDRYLDEVRMVLAAGFLARYYLLREAVYKHGSLRLRVELGTALSEDVRLRLEDAEARCVLRAANTCTECGWRGWPCVGGVDALAVRCADHCDGELYRPRTDYAWGNSRWHYDPETDALRRTEVTPRKGKEADR